MSSGGDGGAKPFIVDRPAERFAAVVEGYDLLARTTSEERYREALSAVPPEARRVLDAGCGSGILAALLAHDGRYVVGLDVSPAMLTLARQHCTRERVVNVAFVIGDIERPPFADQSFDAVVSSYALHGMPFEVGLPALRRLARPGARVVILDIVASWPRLERLRVSRLVLALIAVPRLLLRYGLADAWKVFGVRLRRAWYGPWTTRPLPTRSMFRDACSTWLPGCRISEPRAATMAAVWDAPLAARTPRVE